LAKRPEGVSGAGIVYEAEKFVAFYELKWKTMKLVGRPLEAVGKSMCAMFCAISET
jgi:hypothetical protein